jgi:phosphatidylinositol glycan class T
MIRGICLAVASIALLGFAYEAGAADADSFRESLTLHPLPDGKISILFEFTTTFSIPQEGSVSAQSHHSLTPPALLLPLQYNDVSELTISFVAGQWDQRRSGEAGPLHYQSGGGGGEVRGWLREAADGSR